jgi:POT family proton-dependent oligopeptide transporter
VGQLTLEPRNEFQTLKFTPVEAGYVAVKVLKGGSADAVSLGGIRVNASGEFPASAHPHAQEVWPNVAATGYKPKIAWQLLAYAILTSAEIMVSITCLEFSYTQAPPRMKSLVMSLYLLSVSLGNLFTSLVNKVIQNEDGTSKLPGASYYWFFTALMLATAVVFIFIANTYKGKTYIQDAEPLVGSDQHDLTTSQAAAGHHLKTCPKCGHMNPPRDTRCEMCDTALPAK